MESNLSIRRRFERNGPLYLPRYDVDSPERKIRRLLRHERLRRLRAAATHVQDYNADSGGAAVTSLATNSLTLTAGNLVAITVTSPSSSAPPDFSITDTLGNSFTSLPAATNSSGATTSIQMFYLLSAASTGTDAFTVHVTTAVKLTIAASEFSPGGATISLDVHAEASSNPSSTTISPGSITTTNADSIIVSGGGTGANVTWTAGTNYTLSGTYTSRNAQEWRIVAATGTYDANYTISLAKTSDAVVAAFKAVTAAGSPPFGWNRPFVAPVDSFEVEDY
jgi:hypothetical protein